MVASGSQAGAATATAAAARATHLRHRRRPTNGVILVLLTTFLSLWSGVLWYTHTMISNDHGNGSFMSIASIQQPQPNEGGQAFGSNPMNTNNNNNNHTNRNHNPWEGWQPDYDDTTTEKEGTCSIRTCFRAEHHECAGTCRDGLLPVDNVLLPEPETDWVPDVEVLHRMYLKGKDSQGRPWPPPLSLDYCQAIGSAGGTNDMNKDLLDAVPVRVVEHNKKKNNNNDKNIRVLCMMYTMEDAHETRIRAIRETWAPRCHGFLAFSTKSDPRIPAISIPHDGPEEYSNMWQKVRSIWKFVAKHYLNGNQQFDYFFLGGDDLFVIPENLQHYLTTLGDPNDPFFVGRRFHGYGEGGHNYFNSGGAGYALSRGMVQKLVADFDHQLCSPTKHSSMEDVFIAKCMRELHKIGLTDTRDDKGRERFHPFAPGSHYSWKPAPKGTKPDWYENYNKDWGILLGKDCCAPDSVSFHYIKKPAMVRHLYQLLYHC